MMTLVLVTLALLLIVLTAAYDTDVGNEQRRLTGFNCHDDGGVLWPDRSL